MQEQVLYLQQCTLCPRKCGVNRLENQLGFCKAGKNPKVALVSTHFWEEPPIRGNKGSGTVFFSHCNLTCVFCQNFSISQGGKGKEISVQRLAEIFLEQQGRGVHNINLVSAVQYIPQVVEALLIAKEQGLTIPIVYNSNGYESLEGLALLDGLIDVYLPDLKYYNDATAFQYSKCKEYFATAAIAIKEMRRQVPADVFSGDGIMEKGLLIRHLVLPGEYKDSFLILDWILKELGEGTYVSLLNQYTPMYQSHVFPKIHRRLTTFEYEKVTNHFLDIGLKNGFLQERSSATDGYTPKFDLTGV